MTDIVERLREHQTASHFLKVGDLVAELTAKNEEAADEIERLREALREISKLKISPEDGVNKYIVFMARSIARAAIGVEIDE